VKNRILYIFFLLLLVACKTTKNTAGHRAFHDLHARYNGYYYATESIKEGVDKIKSEFKEDYEFILPVYQNPNGENVKNYFPEMDKAIKKSSLVIQRHTITDKNKNEIPSAGHWIDNNWLVIGQAYFYKREFFQAIETFEYVTKKYKSNDTKDAMVWLIKCYNELGNPSNAEPYLTKLQNDKKLPLHTKRDMHLAAANYHQIIGNTTTLLKELKAAQKFRYNRKDKARINFIIGQLEEDKQEYKAAYQAYKKVLGKGTEYELELHARLKINQLNALVSGDQVKAKADLLAMAKDPKNEEYACEIYYSIAKLNESLNQNEEAIANYRLSSALAKSNQKQKAAACLKLAETYYSIEDYETSEKFYDSTITLLAKTHPKYDKTVERNTSLKNLIEQIRIIRNEDSLLKVASMSESERSQYIKNLIANKKEADKKAQEIQDKKSQAEANEKNNMSGQNFGSGDSDNAENDGFQKNQSNANAQQGFGPAAWYMYNPMLKAQGVNEFTKKFGNRKLEDNWRRSNKEQSLVNNTSNDLANNPNNASGNKTEGRTSNSSSGNDMAGLEQDYLTNLPLTDSLKLKSKGKIIDAYYNLGSIYREQLSDNKNAILTFEKLEKLYHPNKHTPASYYQLYRLFGKQGNLSKANEYKAKIKNEYPQSDYAQVLDLVANNGSASGFVSETEKTYANAYNAYATADYISALNIINNFSNQSVQPSFASKFALLKALCIGKTASIEDFKKALTLVTTEFPKEPAKETAQEILASMNKLGSAIADPQKVEDKSYYHEDRKQAVVMQVGNNTTVFGNLRLGIVDYNLKYYSLKGYAIKDFIIGANDFGLQIKTFYDAKEADAFIESAKKDKNIGPLVNTAGVRIFSIDEEHLLDIITAEAENAYILEYQKLKVSVNK
jgi:tetratricopeptide (TPR) repeat protein